MSNNTNTVTPATNVKGANAPEAVKEPYTIQMAKPADFDPCEEMAIITTKDLSYAVNALFRGGFKDYMGCNLVVADVPEKGRRVIPYLYFRLLPEQEYTEDNAYAFCPAITSKQQQKTSQDSFIESLSIITNPTLNMAARAVTITDDGKSALAEFIPHPKNSGINWQNQYSVRFVDGETIICVTTTDIYQLVKKIYGSKDNENTRYRYTILPINPLATNGNPMTLNMADSTASWILNIRRVKEGALERVVDKTGFVVRTGSIPMVRA